MVKAVTGAIDSLRWRHNGLNSVSNHQPHDCLLKRLFGRRSKKTSKQRVTGLCAGNSPETGEFPAQRASNAENAENAEFDDVIMSPLLQKTTAGVQFGLISIPIWMSNPMSRKICDKTNYQFPNFNGASNFKPHFIMDVITYPCPDYS